MIIERKDMVVLLNMDIEIETTAALQYINHAASLTGAAYGKIRSVLKGYAHDKMKNVMALAEQIHYLGGFPYMRAGTIHTSDDNEVMLFYDLEEEIDAIRRFSIRIEQAEQLKELELSKWLRTILKVEQQHAMFLKKQLCVKRWELNDPFLAAADAVDSSQLWAEKAAKVPIRIKKQN